MKLNIPLALVALVAVTALSMFYLFATAGAAQFTDQVIPIVNVDPTGSLGIVSGTDPTRNDAIDFGYMAAGNTQTKVLVLSVTANSGWQLTVFKNQDLKDSQSSQTVTSNTFTFTSSGAAGPTYATSDTVFGILATPANVVTAGAATAGSDVTVTYELTIPSSQSVGSYSAAHTYTLIVE